MHIDDLRQNWDAFGTTDPLWAILTHPKMRGGKWDLDEFFASGERRIATMMEDLVPHGLPQQRGRALDFGCGVGRLSQALATHFDHVDGVDIAPSMIAQAQRLNRHGDRVTYHVNSAPDLRLFEDDSFDLVFTELVLQHMHPRYSMRYILEFLRLVRPGGAVYFQLPGVRRPSEWLHDNAYRAQIEILEPIATSAPAGSVLTLKARVHNLSPVDWPGEADIKLGNHWKASDGATLMFDDGRAVLSDGLRAWHSVDVELDVTVPNRPGQVILELDLVHEQVTWFEHRDPAVLVRSQLEVYPPNGEAAVEGVAKTGLVAPRMEVYGMPTEFVRDLLTHGGATVRDVLDDDSVGGGWLSHIYIATKP